MFDRVYVEIGNICNMKCSFCSGTKRAPRQMTPEELKVVCEKLRGHTENIYFHVMGEPLLHPELDALLKVAKEYGYKVSITTNGTLLKKRGDVLLENADALHRVSISLHAPGANPAFSSENYLKSCVDFAKKASEGGCFVALRLWNLGSGADNSDVLSYLHKEFPTAWENRRGGSRKIYKIRRIPL